MIRIYGLEDPRDGLCRYCGSSKNPVARGKKHVAQIIRNGTHRNSNLVNWVLELDNLGLRPITRIFEWVSEGEANDAEKERSQQLLLDGHPLVNKILGGAGTNRQGKIFTEEYRHKLSTARKGRKFDDAWKQALSDSHKGKPGSRTGTKQSDEARAKMRAAWARRKLK